VREARRKRLEEKLGIDRIEALHISFIISWAVEFLPLAAEDETEMSNTALPSICFVFLLLLLIPFYSIAEPHTLSVKKGDTLYSIGREYDVSVKQLVEANDIVNPRQLKQGMEITVPHTYVVKRGDTLYSLARAHDTTVAQLRSSNGIDPDAILKVGMVIKLPHDSSTRSAEDSRVAERQSEEPSDEGQESGTPSESKSSTSTKSGENGAVQERTKEVLEERKKQESQETAVRPARYEKGEKPKWPHTGERASLTGKLKGTQITGSKGDKIVAVASGKVVWVAPYRGYGKLVMVEAKSGMVYAYGGNENVYVEVGDRIKAGTVLGTLGINPVAKDAKAFFFVYKNGQPIDPEKAPRG